VKHATYTTITDDDLVEHVRDGWAGRDDPGSVWVRDANGDDRAVIQCNSLDAADRLIAAATALRETIAATYHAAGQLRVGWLIELPGLERGARILKITPHRYDPTLLLRLRTHSRLDIRPVQQDQLVRVIDQGEERDACDGGLSLVEIAGHETSLA